MSTTWRCLIDASVEQDQRACLFCGSCVGGVHKTISVEEVFALLGTQRAQLERDVLHCTYRNLCMATLASCAIEEEPGPMHEKFTACACCQHWVGKRATRPHFLFPLQALRYHLRSMPKLVGGKQLDTRIVHRMSIELCRTTGGLSNFFRSVMSTAELAVCAQIAAGTISDVTRIVAAALYEQNARAPFMRDSRLTVLIREGLAVAGDSGDCAVGMEAM